MDESSASKGGLWWATALTILYLGVIFYLRGYDALDLLYGGKLNELGDFFAGVFSPVAFGWLIYGYFLQSKELGLQRKELSLQSKELGLQRKELERTGNTLSQQTEVLLEQLETERQRTRPYLDLRSVERDRLRAKANFALYNSGGQAYNMDLTVFERGRELIEMKRDQALVAGGHHDFSISDDQGPHIYVLTVGFTSEHQERFYQRWEIQLIDNNPRPEFRKKTRDPVLLKEGQSPPPPDEDS